MKRICVAGLSIVLLLSAMHANTQGVGGKLTLKRAVETGITNNLRVQQAGLQVQTEAINWKQAKLNRFPNLNGIAGSGINQGRSIDPFTNSYSNQQISYSSYGLNSSVMLFNAQALQNMVKQNGLIYQAAQMDWQQAKDDLTLNIILAYLQVLSYEDQLMQAVNQAALTGKQVERLGILNREGAIAPSLLYEIQGQYGNDQLNIISTRNLLETARISLSQLMNVPYDKDVQLERISVETYMVRYVSSADTIYKLALQQFPLARAVVLRRAGAEKGVRIAKAGLFPTLSLNGSANTNFSNAARNEIFIGATEVITNDFVIVGGNSVPVVRRQNNFSSQKIGYSTQLNNNLFTSLNLTLRIPIFNALQARNNIRLAKMSLKHTELIAQTTTTQLQQFIEQAYSNLNSAWDRYKILLDQVTAFKEAFRAAEVRFNMGVGNSIDYLTAKNNLDRANINLLMTTYDFVLRTKILDYYQGRNLWGE